MTEGLYNEAMYVISEFTNFSDKILHVNANNVDPAQTASKDEIKVYPICHSTTYFV